MYGCNDDDDGDGDGDGDGRAGTFFEGQKKSERETGGDMKSFNVKDKMEFTWVDCFLAHYCEKC